MTTAYAQTTYAKKIAAALSERLRNHQMIAKVGMRQRDNLLYVALEPDPKAVVHTEADVSATDSAREPKAPTPSQVIPEPQLLLPVLQQALIELNLGWLKLVKVSGRLPGQASALWQDELLFRSAAPIAKTLMRPTPVGDVGDVNMHIDSDMRGQMLIGHKSRRAYYQYTYNVAHGGVLNVGTAPTITPRSTPLACKPRPFINLLDRQTVLPVVRESLLQELPVEIYAGVGFGKTVLLRHLAHNRQLGSAFADGVVYFSTHRQPASDLLQALYDAFYDTSPRLKPSYTQAAQALKKKRALMILDNLTLDKEEVKWLMAALPACTFVLISQARFYWRDGAAIALKGLPLPESIVLMQIELGRDLSAKERLAAKPLWTALSGNPLQLRRAAAHMKASNQSLMALVQSMQASPGQTISGRSLFQKMVAKLSNHQRSVLALMGAMGGVALSAEQSQAIAQVPETLAVLNELVSLHLVEFTGSGYQLGAGLTEIVQQSFAPYPWLTKATDYFTIQETSTLQRGGHTGSTDAMIHLLTWAQRQGKWQKGLALARRLDPLLTLSGQWEQWQQVLTYSLQAAEQLGDGTAEAWSLHQLGTRSLAIGDTARAASWLSRALRLRQQLGDRDGGAVTRHNLGLIVPPLVMGEGTLPVTRRRRRSSVKWISKLLPWGAVGIIAVLLGWLVNVAWELWNPEEGEIVGQVLLDDTAISFGERALNSTSDTQGTTLSNATEHSLDIRQIVLSGAGDFALAVPEDSESCQVYEVLAPGETCKLSATFTPTVPGNHSAGISVVMGLQTDTGEVIETKSRPVVLEGVGQPQEMAGSGSRIGNNVFRRNRTDTNRQRSTASDLLISAPIDSGDRVLKPTDSEPVETMPAPAGDDLAANQQLQANDDEITLTANNSVVSIDVLYNDIAPEGAGLSLASVSQAEAGVVEINDNIIIYRPNEQATSDRFVYEVKDAAGNIDRATVRITIAPVADVPSAPPAVDNSDPVAIDFHLTVQLNEPLTIDLLEGAYDPDPEDELSLASMANLEGGGQLEDNGDGTVTYRHGNNVPSEQSGNLNDSFEYTLTDGRGGTGRGLISITVVVPPPVVSPPIETIEPVEPAEPIGPVEPVEPIEPVEPVEPVERPEEPVDAEEAVDSELEQAQ